MVVQVQTISRRDSADIAARFQQRAAELRERVGLRLADVIVDNSPVDTGAYILGHVAGTQASTEAASRTSHGRQRNQNRAQFVNLARGNLYRSVSAEAIQASAEIWFRNVTVHAPFVEYLHGYAVYATARASASQIIRDVAVEMGMQAR